MTGPGDDAFGPLRAHLQADHHDELVLIARAFGPDPDTTQVTLTDIAVDGLRLELREAHGARRCLDVPFATRLHRPADAKVQFATLVRAARHALGLPEAADPA